ncbi:hypothetical protein DFS33DRAFT_347930 [Desarmillaria ectypa]|nr:hypothetical protein DFS33DRAFT_347930 [Desarmillaria ectypa]
MPCHRSCKKFVPRHSPTYDEALHQHSSSFLHLSVGAYAARYQPYSISYRNTQMPLFHKHLQLFPRPADSLFLLTMISMTTSSMTVKKRMKTRTRTPGIATMRMNGRRRTMGRTKGTTIIMMKHSKCSLPHHCVFWSFLCGHLTSLESCSFRSLLACIP